jgi:hypothetical protein
MLTEAKCQRRSTFDYLAPRGTHIMYKDSFSSQHKDQSLNITRASWPITYPSVAPMLTMTPNSELQLPGRPVPP